MNAKIFLCSILGCILGVASTIHAETTFRLATRSEAIPENGTVSYTVLRTAENEFSFLPPSQWRQAVNQKASALSWTAPDYRTSIQMQLHGGSSNGIPKLKPEPLQQELLSRHKQAKILEEFPCYSSGSTGLAFDWERPGEGGFTIRSRSAFLPIAGGLVELTLTASKDQFENRQMDLMRFLNSLRITAEKAVPVSKVTKP